MATPNHKLKQWRQRHGMTLEDVQDLCGVSAATISRAENGTHELSPLLKVRIAKGLGVRVRDLFGLPSQGGDETAVQA